MVAGTTDKTEVLDESIDQVTITGARGPIADALAKRLRDAGRSVENVRQGDDILVSVRRASAVVVLDGATGGDYSTALKAVAHALGQVGAKPVIAVSAPPGYMRAPKDFFKDALLAEQAFRARGFALTVLRASYLLGTPAEPGPHDVAFLPKFGRCWIPGNGKQGVTPILLDDFADAVVRAVGVPDPIDETIHVGAAEVCVLAVASAIAGPDVKKRHFRALLLLPWVTVSGVDG